MKGDDEFNDAEDSYRVDDDDDDDGADDDDYGYEADADADDDDDDYGYDSDDDDDDDDITPVRSLLSGNGATVARPIFPTSTSAKITS